MNSHTATAAGAKGTEGRLHRLSSNQSLLLTDPGTVWYLRQGNVELLGTRFHDGAPTTGRRHLFRLPGRRAMFGSQPVAASGELGLMAIAAGPAELAELPAEQVFADLVRYGSWIEGWASQLAVLILGDLETPPTVTRHAAASELTLDAHEVFASDERVPLCLRVLSGKVTAGGREQLALAADTADVLMPPELWFEVASETAEIQLVPLAELSADQRRDAVGGLQRLLALRLKQIGDEEERAELERRRRSRELQDLETHAAYHDLAAVLDPLERFHLKPTPLLTAATVVGQSLGIPIEPPAASEDMHRVNDPIEAIARASRVRWRMVLLGAEWWKHDSGPLLAYLGEQQRQPVALLPRGGTYEIVYPDRRVREPLPAKVRDEICPDAYMFYRPLPNRVAGVFDLLKFTARGRLGETLLVAVMGLCATLLGMIVPKVTGQLVDSAIPNADRSMLFELAALLTISGLASALFTYIQMMTTVRVSTVAEVVSQSAMWDRLLKFRPDFFRRFSSGDLQTRVDAVGEINRELNGATLRPMISGLLALLNFLLLWYYSWKLAKIALWVGLVVLLFTLLMSQRIRRLSFRLHDVEGDLHGLMVQLIGGVGKIRTAGAEYRAFNHWVSKYTPQLHLVRNIQLYKDLMTIFNLALPSAALAFLFWRAAKLTVELEINDPERISIGDFIAFNTAFTLYLTGWSDLSNTLVGVLDTMVKGHRIRPLLEGTPEVREDAADPGRLTGHVQFESVSFRYAANGPLILEDVSFEIQPGEFVAFVGPSGSGKSTVLRLLLGFERPEYGRVLYDGQDLAGSDVLAVRRQIGSVLQNGCLNAGSIVENVSNNARLTHGEIWDAIADAGMSDDIKNMPMGLHTMVAEGGVNLSGGQRQRLLIARALVTRPRLVFFDEATSALDNRTQATVSESLDRRKVTRLVIAHRLSTIQNADRIYVLDKGRIVQQGTFQELRQQEGVFRDLVSRQMI